MLILTEKDRSAIVEADKDHSSLGGANYFSEPMKSARRPGETDLVFMSGRVLR